MPSMPHMSPAAIGCSVVRLRGWPVSAKRAPIPARAASGQPSPLEDETVTTASSAIRSAASRAVMTFDMGASEAGGDADDAAGLRRFQNGQRGGQRPDAVGASGSRLALAADRGMELAQRPDIEAFAVERQRELAGGGAQGDGANRALGHHV